MPSVFSHPAVPLAVAAIAGRALVSPRLLLAGVIASVLPDADVLAFRFGIAYGHELGHRGASHSLLAAVLLGLLAAAAARRLHSTRLVAFFFVAGAGASHGLLDMLTTGGHGIA
jgi:inner membrane protein